MSRERSERVNCVFEGASTFFTLLAIVVVSACWNPTATSSFLVGGWQKSGYPGLRSAPAGSPALTDSDSRSVSVGAKPAALDSRGLFVYGLGFGVLAALVRCGNRVSKSSRVSLRAGDIEVAEKTETKPVQYLQNVPRTIMDKSLLDKVLGLVPEDQWEDPPEDSYLYVLKMYAETYGEGKATKMAWWDFLYMRVNTPEDGGFYTAEEIAQDQADLREKMLTGILPMWVPGPSQVWPTGASFKWRGPEPFAGDQTRTPVTDGLFATQFLKAMAFYRDGLKPWQRGLEIGMAHGYFLIGPFVSLGPLRNTPEAATVGLLAGAAVVAAVSTGGKMFGTVMKPVMFDKEGEKPGTGFQSMIDWHLIGGLGGAGFAHALITVFGS